MKRSEATPEILEALEDPENIYTFEEDEKEMDLVFGYIRSKGWSLKGGLTEGQRKELDDYMKEIEAKRAGDIYKISRYTNKNEKEFFAECFTIYELGEETLPSYIQEMFKVVLK